ncbi:MAG: type IV pilus assembly protein PilM [Planctomycetaceae bacterium]|nr:type IV pilus assembly protein PilM [Planctomycetaceae bacterium]
MSDERGYWGLEIGQAGLKALRLQSVEGAGKAVATNFDYVPHAKILSQPDAVPEELIASALDTFLSRNDVRSDVVAISVPGQNALARFIQLPPVEQGKVAQIVTYEAKQQIPFPLEDVIWDYQTLGGGAEESGYLLEAEVGLFAMKRDLVMQQLKPLTDRKVEVELIQVAPLALYNFLCYDRLKIRPGEPFTAGDEYTVVCEMGTDTTILVVTNGAKIWIRNVPIGGNHFTRALVKDMKLTFAKAEHLKNNATKSPDPKAVFQAMRPVFNDYVAEIQRSIGYFSSVNRSSKIVKVLGVGNGFKLAGLQKFLQQNLQYPVERVERFESLVGEKVLSDDVFRENILGFIVPYGLAVQAMGQTTIHTTLLPPEIATARKIRQKKPWAALAAATLLGIFGLSAFGYGNVMRSVSEQRFGPAETAVSGWNQEADGFSGRYKTVETSIATIDEKSTGLVGPLGTREYWLELLRGVNEALPRDDADTVSEEDITKRNRIRVTSFTTLKMPELANWYAAIDPLRVKYMSKQDQAVPPSGPGYVVTIVGEHFHKSEKYGVEADYVANTLLKNLQEWEASQSAADKVPVGKIGISHAVIIEDYTTQVPDPRNFTELNLDDGNPFGPRGPGGSGMSGYAGGGEEGYTPPEATSFGPGAAHGGGGGGTRGGFGPRAPQVRSLEPILNQANQPMSEEEMKYPPIDKTSFTVQFVWRPIAHEERTDKRPAVTEEEAAAAKAAVEAATAAATGGVDGMSSEH